MIMSTVKITIVLFVIGLKVSVGATDIRDIPGEGRRSYAQSLTQDLLSSGPAVGIFGNC